MLPFDPSKPLGMPDESGKFKGNGNPYVCLLSSIQAGLCSMATKSRILSADIPSRHHRIARLEY
jgi:hypothetical protein